MQPMTRPEPACKRVSILGSTGSIGCSTLDVIAQHRDRYTLDTLTAQQNVEKLIEQARQYQPRHVVIGDEVHHATLKEALSGTGISVASGSNALMEAAARPVDWVMAAIVGVAGLAPTLAAIQTGATIAFASKECLVCAGELMLEACRKSGSQLLPVDSEHNALFQVFDFSQAAQVQKLVLTASGGPFLHRDPASLHSVTPDEAVAHPNWSMGAKISVDSATMMNKALEMIEAYHLFPVQADQIEAILHPESVIHSLLYYRDGSVLAQLGAPDMRIPIAYTLGWPERLSLPQPPLDLAELHTLRFETPCETRFPALRLARDVLRAPQSAAIIFNAANEIAVQAFLDGRLAFPAITALVETLLNSQPHRAVTSIEDALYLDAEIRAQCATHIGSL